MGATTSGDPVWAPCAVRDAIDAEYGVSVALDLGAAAARGRAGLDRDAVVAVLTARAKGVADRGKAKQGEKTMLDAWAPDAAATKAMVAAKGRAARLGDRALGDVDPNAASAAPILRALAASL